MKKMSKRMLGVLLICSFIISCSAGCGSNIEKTSNNNQNIENDDTIVATINGKDISRKDVGDDLRKSEKEVISNYINSQLLSEFFSSVEVTEEELNAQLQMLKAQVGDSNWDMYLAYYGGGDENSFKEMLREDLKREKYISSRSETITISDEELAEKYNEDPNSYNIAAIDAIFLDSEEELNKAIELRKSGKTLEEISEDLGKDIDPARHTYYKSNITWVQDFANSQIGDIVYTTVESGNYVIGKIVELNTGINNEKVRDDMLSNMKYDKAYDEVEQEYIEFLKNQSATILGENYVLYEEEVTDESVNNNTDESVNNNTDESVNNN